MPELPEVEWGRKVAAQACVGRRILKARCAEDRIVFDGVTPTRVQRVRGATVVAVHRWGKQLWFELDRGPHPLFHFGMTGAFLTRDGSALPLASSPKAQKDEAWPPRFTKIHLFMDDGNELVMVNKRRLGRIRLRASPRDEPPLSRLGFDPLLALPEPADFAQLVAGRKVTLKGLLLDQSFAAGVGNWIADEVLYQARLDPRRRSSDLSSSEVRRLRNVLGRIIRRAVAVDAAKERFPRAWLFHRRWGRVDGARTVKGEPIEFLDVAGRTTAWVPVVQG